MKRENKVFLHTGTNLGNKLANLERAVELIGKKIGSISQASLIYHTKAWGITDQPDFLNQALEVQTTLNPFELLEAIHYIEQKMGRKREIKWGERLIDIDILFYSNQIINTEHLTIPHPYLHYRNFVLVPMLEIAPSLEHPILRMTIAELCSNSEDELQVEAFLL